ncbi:thioredoxin [Pedobacter yonginense]|uniref:Thioredoxin n=1 Tax=Pedobacter yonginense TaxID=651869 RepID=A0A317EP26_9SPHI|nr:TlpA disulfide reductase family protein [Pedobacter yonginense]PWS28620.1 thioredoxin [Pedobacter yonginense]
MKRILFLLALLPGLVKAQNAYTISGSVLEIKEPAKAYLAMYTAAGFKDVDSTEIKNGNFLFRGTVAEPQSAIIAIRRNGAKYSGSQNDYQSFFIENSNITIVGKDSIKDAIIKGSVSNQENREQEEMVRPLINNIISLQNRYGKKTIEGVYLKSAEERKKAGDSIQNFVSAIKAIHVKFAETHLNSFMGLYTYNLYVLDSKFDPAQVEPLFKKFSASLQSSPLGTRTAEKIEIGKRKQAGVKATDFTQMDMNGKPFTLSSLRGKYVLVDFWASWCVPCRAENPYVVKAYNALKDKNFEIVSVSLDQGKAAWLAAIKADGMPWIHVSDLKYWKNAVAEMYGISSVPQNILINPEGVIIAKNLRGDDLLNKIQAYIK